MSVRRTTIAGGTVPWGHRLAPSSARSEGPREHPAPRRGLWALALAGLLLPVAGCVLVAGSDDQRAQIAIRVEGSDTMVNVAQAWAEEYHKLHPEISVQVLGGGSGVGIASLIDGNCDLADSSRKMTPKEIQNLLDKRGLEAKETVVGYDALAVYVHRDNPLDSISLDELAEIYGEDGAITRWSQLGLAEPPGGNDRIVFLNRQNSSGTYAYFQEAVLGKHRDYKLGSIDQSGSKDVVVLIAHTPGAIGYSGMGYDAPGVKMLRVSKRRGEPGVAPTVENARNGSYPITRPLQIYTAGDPAGPVRRYLDWILSPQGQAVVAQQGYVPKGGGIAN
ncbi:MAG: phosphate ABC transporter substrate-binding protein [Thermoguttaceae bacterium]